MSAPIVSQYSGTVLTSRLALAAMARHTRLQLKYLLGHNAVQGQLWERIGDASNASEPQGVSL